MHLCWLSDTDCQDVSLVGGKAANLSRLAADYRVPPGFCVTTQAFEHALQRQPSPSGQLVSLPDDLFDDVARAYEALGNMYGGADPAVAVRSSAADEDGSTASFAGQHESFLHVTGIDAVVEAILKCRASAFSERAVEYRRHQGLSLDAPRMAVLVQRLVPAEASAVVFSTNPVTRDAGEVMVNASWGLGESIVCGTVTPDTYIVGKGDLLIRERWISDKECMTVPVAEGTREVEVPQQMRSVPALSDALVIEIAQLARELAIRLGWEVDLECAIYGGEVYLLQCRPITTL